MLSRQISIISKRDDKMKVFSSYVREQERYTKNKLKVLLSYDDEGIETFIKNLKAYGVLKTVRNSVEQQEMSDLVDEDVEILDETVDNDACLYVFTYVGVVTCGKRILKIYPKYLLSKKEPLEEMKIILKVLERYSHSDEQIINLYNGEGENKSFNILAVILYLLNDYHEYGIYNNSEDIIEVNGEGRILWEKTINEGFALIGDNRPYYIELYTEKTIDDDTDYFRRLHACILTECFEQLHEAQLDDLFEMVEVQLSEEKLEDFGEKDYILDKLHNELNIQFNTRRQILLKTLYTYVAQNRKIHEADYGISMYGTNSFNLVWETACAEVFDNKLNTALMKLNLSVPINKSFNGNLKLIDIIDKPLWKDQEVKKYAKDTLTPDIVSVGNEEQIDYFVISDAKYYNLQLETSKNLRGNPGISDVTKQYLYQLAYMKFIRTHKIKIVRNCFLMPTEGDEVIDKGTVSLEMLYSLGLQNIQIRLLPAKKVFEYYLTRKKLDISYLELKDAGANMDNILDFNYTAYTDWNEKLIADTRGKI